MSIIYNMIWVTGPMCNGGSLAVPATGMAAGWRSLYFHILHLVLQNVITAIAKSETIQLAGRYLISNCLLCSSISIPHSNHVKHALLSRHAVVNIWAEAEMVRIASVTITKGWQANETPNASFQMERKLASQNMPLAFSVHKSSTFSVQKWFYVW